jgi:hypothetical protein
MLKKSDLNAYHNNIKQYAYMPQDVSFTALTLRKDNTKYVNTKRNENTNKKAKQSRYTP